MRIVTIIPARETSRRLPGKHFQPFFGGLSMLEYLTARLKAIPGEKVIAGPVGQTKLAGLASQLGWQYAAPEAAEENVANRIMAVAAKFDAVVLAYGDSPFLSADLALTGLSWIEKGADFWGNIGPSGFRLKIFRPIFLYDAQDWKAPEHVLNHFGVPEGAVSVLSHLHRTTVKFSVDTSADLEFCREIAGKVGLHGSSEDVLREGIRIANALDRHTNVRETDAPSDTRFDFGPRAPTGR